MTLVEMMLVMALTAMFTLWGLHSWQHYQKALRLEKSAKQLRIYLTGLQTEANWYNRSVILWGIQGIRGCVGQGDTPVDCASAGNRSFILPDNGIELADFTAKVMGFYGLRNSAQSGHITLQNEVGKIRVVLSARGRLRLCSEDTSLLSVPVCQ